MDRARDRDDWGAGRLSAEAEARFIEGVEYCGRFFVETAEAQRALNECGHRRVTVDVDLVIRDEDLIRSATLSREVANDLDPWVRAKYLELWQLAHVVDPF